MKRFFSDDRWVKITVFVSGVWWLLVTLAVSGSGALFGRDAGAPVQYLVAIFHSTLIK